MGKGSSAKEAAGVHNFARVGQCEKQDPHLPSLIVFDLDDCLWTPEMHELPGCPSIPVEGPLDPLLDPEHSPLGTVGLRVPSRRKRSAWGGHEDDDCNCVSLYEGARLALRELALDPKFRGVQVAAASSSLEPSYSRACLQGLEVLPELYLADMLSYQQIGRTGSLTPRKTTHFWELHKESDIPYDEMLFFDDCNWGDHCADVTNEYGVISQRTPSGMTLDEFHKGLEKYRTESIRRDSVHKGN